MTRKTITIELLHFIPDGSQHLVHCPVAQKNETGYLLMRESGYRLEAEILGTGQVRTSIAKGHINADSRITNNEVELIAGIESMLDARLFAGIPF